MLNGKKSYLLSFTALFTKKGYELKLGLDYLVNVNNNYHLTAPINSTYSAFLEDTMKGAGKVPSTATGVFGTTFQAEYTYEIEGTGMESVLATVVNYLNDIHQFLAADSSTARAPIAVQVTPVLMSAPFVPETMNMEGIHADYRTLTDAETGDNMIGEGVDIDSVVDTYNPYSEKPLEIDVHSAAKSNCIPDELDIREVNGYTHSEQVVPESWEPMKELVVKEKPKVSESMVNFSPTENRSTDFISRIQGFAAGFKDDTFEGETEFVVFSTAKLPQDTLHGKIGEFSPSRNVTQEVLETEIQGGQSSDTSGVGFDAVYEVHNAVNRNNAEAATPQAFSISNTYSAGFAELIKHTYGGTDLAEDADSDLFLEAENHFDAGGYADSIILTENIKHTVAGDPEVTRLARLMEIMYGSQIFEHIESGIEDIVMKAASGDLSEANVSVLKKSVIESLQKALVVNRTDAMYSITEVAEPDGNLEGVVSLTETAVSSSNLSAIEDRPKHAVSNNNVAAVRAVPEQAMIQMGYDGRMETPVTGDLSGESKEVFTHDIGRAITEANGRLAERNDPEYGASNPVKQGVLDLKEMAENGLAFLDTNHPMSEVADYHDRFKNVVVQKTEVSSYKDYLTYHNHKENSGAGYVTEFNAEGQETEVSSYRDREIVSDMHTDTKADSASDYDSQLTAAHSADVEAPNYESVLHEHEWGDVLVPEGCSVHHTVEMAESVNRDDILLEHGDSGKGETSVDAVKHDEGSNSIGEVILPGLINELDSSHSGTMLNAAVQAGESAQNILSLMSGGVASAEEAESITPTNGADIQEISKSIRKRQVRETDIQQSTDAGRKRQRFKTDIETSADAGRKLVTQVTEIKEPLGAKRKKKAVETGIQQAESAKRHKIIETAIGEAEEGQLITHPESKKARLWLIAGKIASWNIWNWKKTR